MAGDKISELTNEPGPETSTFVCTDFVNMKNNHRKTVRLGNCSRKDIAISARATDRTERKQNRINVRARRPE